jgi:hypothetical protein
MKSRVRKTKARTCCGFVGMNSFSRERVRRTGVANIPGVSRERQVRLRLKLQGSKPISRIPVNMACVLHKHKREGGTLSSIPKLLHMKPCPQIELHQECEHGQKQGYGETYCMGCMIRAQVQCLWLLCMHGPNAYELPRRFVEYLLR